MMLSNPFIVGRAIRAGEQFVGRFKIKQTILGNLSNMGSTSIIGERRTGKTSLLLDIQRELRELTAPRPFTAVYIDCSTTRTIETFWTVFIEELRLEANRQFAAQLDGLRSLSSEAEILSRNIIRTLSSINSIVMLLDEFDCILESDEFAGDFLLNLRNYGTLSQVAYVTASRQRLETHYTNPTPSPFFNIFLTTVLGLFSEKEVRTLLERNLPTGMPIFSELEIAYLVRFSGCHPFFVQLAGFILFRIKYSEADESQSDWKDQHQNEFEIAARQHLKYYWNKSTAEEKALLVSLSEGMLPPSVPGRVLKNLLERCLVSKDGDRVQPFSPIWSEWILQHAGSMEERMIETLAIPTLLKAVDFIFGEGSRILQERRERRRAERELPDKDSEAGNRPANPAMSSGAITSQEEARQGPIEEIAWLDSEKHVKHLMSLLETYTRNYYLAKEEYAKWGSALVPSIIVHNLDEAEDGILKITKELQSILSRVYGKQIVVPQLVGE